MRKFISILCIFLVLALTVGTVCFSALADEATANDATCDATNDATGDVIPGDNTDQTMWMVLIVLSVIVIGVCATQRRFD